MKYSHRIREVEHGAFTPLVCTSTGGTTVFYKQLADFTHWGQFDNSQIIHGVITVMSFALCKWGSRSSVHNPVQATGSVVLTESRLIIPDLYDMQLFVL